MDSRTVDVNVNYKQTNEGAVTKMLGMINKIITGVLGVGAALIGAMFTLTHMSHMLKELMGAENFEKTFGSKIKVILGTVTKVLSGVIPALKSIFAFAITGFKALREAASGTYGENRKNFDKMYESAVQKMSEWKAKSLGVLPMVIGQPATTAVGGFFKKYGWTIIKAAGTLGIMRLLFGAGSGGGSGGGGGSDVLGEAGMGGGNPVAMGMSVGIQIARKFLETVKDIFMQMHEFTKKMLNDMINGVREQMKHVKDIRASLAGKKGIGYKTENLVREADVVARRMRDLSARSSQTFDDLVGQFHELTAAGRDSVGALETMADLDPFGKMMGRNQQQKVLDAFVQIRTERRMSLETFDELKKAGLDLDSFLVSVNRSLGTNIKSTKELRFAFTQNLVVPFAAAETAIVKSIEDMQDKLDSKQLVPKIDVDDLILKFELLPDKLWKSVDYERAMQPIGKLMTDLYEKINPNSKLGKDFGATYTDFLTRFSTAFAALDTNRIEGWLTEALNLFGLVSLMIVEFFKGFITGLGGATGGVDDLQGVIHAILADTDSMKNFTELARSLGELVPKLLILLAEIAVGTAELTVKFGESIKSFIEFISFTDDFVANFLISITALTVATVTAVSAAITLIMPAISAAIVLSLAEITMYVVSWSIDLLKDLQEGMANAAATVAKFTADVVIDTARVLALIAEIFALGIVGVAESTGSAFKDMITQMREFSQDIDEFIFQPMIISAREWGSNLIDAFVEGLISGKDKISDFFSDIVIDVKKIFKIESPSRVFEEMGTNVMVGYNKGLESTENKLPDVLGPVFEGRSLEQVSNNYNNSRKSQMGNITINVGDGGNPSNSKEIAANIRNELIKIFDELAMENGAI